MRIDLSQRTVAFAVLALTATFGVYGAIAGGLVPAGPAVVVADVFDMFVMLAAAALTLWCATRFAAEWALRRTWTFIALGVTAYALGSVSWAFYEVVLRQAVPFPGLPDLFYLAVYPLMAVGLFSAVLSFRHLADVRAALANAGVIATASLFLVYLRLIGPILADAQVPALNRVLSALHPFGDVILIFWPALALAFVTRQMGGGRLAWPWWPVALGAILAAVGEVSFLMLDWYGVYSSGTILDAWLTVGFVLIATGASFAVDIQFGVAPSTVRSQVRVEV